MFYNNISYLVGSANAKLADDIKKIQKENKLNNINNNKTNKSNVRFPSYLFCNSIRQAVSNEAKDFRLDFEIVKISCKKENYSGSSDKNQNKFKHFFFENAKLEFLIKALLFFLIGTIIGFTIFRVVLLAKSGKSNKLSNQNGLDHDPLRMYKRAANIYSTNELLEWSGEILPMCYQVEPLTFFDSDQDGVGDLKGVLAKFSYFQSEFINCLVIKNLQGFFNIETNQFVMNQSNVIDDKIGSFNDLMELIDSAHKIEIRVILEIDLTGTSIYHELFDKDFKNIYMTNNKSVSSRNWILNRKHRTFYFTNDRQDFAYFDYDSLKAQAKIIDIFKYWLNFKPDGFYLTRFNQIQYKNTSSLEYFYQQINELRRSASVPTFTLIGPYSSDDLLKNHLLNIYHVEIDATQLRNDIETNEMQSIDSIESYLNNDKKIIWSLKNLPNNHDLLKEFYLFMYALPGLSLISQGDELEKLDNEISNETEIFYWNNQNVNRGFSNKTQLKFKNFPILKTDLKSNQNKERSLVNFFKLFNSRIKTKLNDLKPIKTITTHVPQKPKRPQPFAFAKYDSYSSSYLQADKYYKITTWNSVLKVTRQIHNFKVENSLKFYRNVLFLFNFSKLNISIDHLITLPTMRNKRIPMSTIHVIYDSTYSMPEYIQLDEDNRFGLYRLLSNHHLAIEY